MNYYERHIGDYLKDTAHLSLMEHGVYTRLMDVYYTREGGIPAADAARLIGARSKEERAALSAVLGEFFELRDGLHMQDRCEREIQRYQGKQAKAKASADARWSAQRSQSERNANASATAMRTHSERNADGMHRAPVPRHQTPDTRKEKEGSASDPPRPIARERAPAIARPDGVSEQVWDDWMRLRKAKRAPVTQTVLDGAASEAGKAGLSIEDFLRVWCRRGSQGLEAAWIKPAERINGHGDEPGWRREQRERNEEALGPFAARKRVKSTVIDIGDGGEGDGAAKLLG